MFSLAFEFRLIGFVLARYIKDLIIRSSRRLPNLVHIVSNNSSIVRCMVNRERQQGATLADVNSQIPNRIIDSNHFGIIANFKH